MDPLEFFEEEYLNFNTSVDEINSLVERSKEIFTTFLALEKELSAAVQTKNLNIETINSILESMESLIRNSKNFINSAEKSSHFFQKEWT